VRNVIGGNPYRSFGFPGGGLFVSTIGKLLQNNYPNMFTGKPAVHCPNCDYRGEAKYGKNNGISILLILTTWWLAFIPLFLYLGFAPNWVCPKCENKNVIKQDF